MPYTMRTIFQWGTRPEKDAPITWWDTPQTAEKVAAMFHQEIITNVKTTYDDSSDIDKPEAKFYGPVQINDKVDGNPKRKIIVFRGDQNDVYTGEDIHAELDPKTGILTIHKHPMNNLAQYPAGGHQGWKRA